MNRRGFLGLLAATPIVAVSVPALVSLIERPHRWMGGWDICAVCRATAEEVVDGRAPRSCEGTPRRIFLPSRIHEADMNRYLTSNTAWYLKDTPAYVRYIHVRQGNSIMTREEFTEAMAKALNQLVLQCDVRLVPVYGSSGK